MDTAININNYRVYEGKCIKFFGINEKSKKKYLS